MGSKINPFKSLISGGAGFLTGGWPGAAAGVLGSLGGGGKSPKGGGMPPLPPELMQRLLGLADKGSKELLDAPGMARGYRRDVMEDSSRFAEGTGARIAQETGNPYLATATTLDARSRATEDANRFQRDLYSPEGKAAAYQGALGLYSPVVGAYTGLEGLRLQGKQISAQNRQPTVWEQLSGSLGGSLPQLIEWWKNKDKKPVQQQSQPVNSGGQFGLGQPYQWGFQP